MVKEIFGSRKVNNIGFKEFVRKKYEAIFVFNIYI
jgi:hypothetical protein